MLAGRSDWGMATAASRPVRPRRSHGWWARRTCSAAYERDPKFRHHDGAEVRLGGRRQTALERLFETHDGSLPSVPSGRGLARLLPLAPPRRGGVERVEDGIGGSPGVSGRNDNRIVPVLDVVLETYWCGDNHGTCGHGLKGRQGVAFGPGSEEHDSSLAVQGRKVVKSDHAVMMDPGFLGDGAGAEYVPLDVPFRLECPGQCQSIVRVF